MKYDFSSRIKNVKPSATREIFNLLKNTDIISFAGGFPSIDNLPCEKVSEFLRENLLSEKGKSILQYGSTLGFDGLIDNLVKYVRRYEINNITRDNIIVLSGGQQGIDLVCRVMLNKGDNVLVFSPTYLAALQIFNAYEANAIAMDVNEKCEIDFDKLENILKSKKIKLMYLVPTFSNPTGDTMALEERKRLYDLLKKYNLLLVEDDPYSELRYSGSRVPSIKSLDDNGNVIYISSFSKIISPGIRVGFAVGDQSLIRAMEVAKQGVDIHSSNLSQSVVYSYLQSGEIENRIKLLCKEYKEKRDIMLNGLYANFPLNYIKLKKPDGGLFIWIEIINKTIDTDELFHEMVKNKVAYVPGSEFFVDSIRGKNCFRLNFSNSNKEDIEKGIKIMGNVLKDKLDK